MRIRKVVKASKDVSQKTKIVASKSTDEMLQAFEDKLEEFGIQSKTCVNSETDIAASDNKSVEIYEGDVWAEYVDDNGEFGEPGATYNMRDIKEYWNNENMSDPVLEGYASFDEWWADTSSWLREV